MPVPRPVLLDWERALYGAIMMGWGVSLPIPATLMTRYSAVQSPG